MVVREFYANGKDQDECKVIVRRKVICYDSKTINRFYELPDIVDDSFTELMERPPFERIIKHLCQKAPDTKWTIKDGEISCFPANALDVVEKAWHMFIGAKLMPTTHLSDVHKDRAVLLYAIVKGYSIDVGKVIHQSITKSLKNTSKGLACPMLIASLCEKAGIFWNSTETVIHPLSVLNDQYFFHIEKKQGENGNSVAETSRSRRCTALAMNVTIEQRLDQIEQRLKALEQRQKSHNHKIAMQEDRREKFMQMFVAQLGIDTASLPLPISYPASPASKPDEQDES